MPLSTRRNLQYLKPLHVWTILDKLLHATNRNRKFYVFFYLHGAVVSRSGTAHYATEVRIRNVFGILAKIFAHTAFIAIQKLVHSCRMAINVSHDVLQTDAMSRTR